MAKSDDCIVTFCTFIKEDGIINVNYIPYVVYIYVDEKYRGYWISEQMIEKAIEYARELGFKEVYIVLDHE